MTFKRNEIVNDEYVEEFFLTRNITSGTKDNYIARLKNYSNFTGMLPKELILEADKEQDAGVKTRLRKIKRHVNGFARYLEEQKYSPITVKRHIIDIKSFYTEFDINFPAKVRTENYTPSGMRDLPTMDEIRKVFRSASTRDRALILLHLSSGMAGNEVRNLKYDDFLDAIGAPRGTPIKMLRNYVDKTTIPRWLIIRKKTNYEYVTFCSPECAMAIVDYLEEREYEFEWLFNSRIGGGKLSISTHTGIFERLNDKNKLGYKENGKTRKFTSHQLRRVFATNMSRADLERHKINFMIGHKENDTTAAYFKNDVERAKNDYMKGLKYVTLGEVEIIRVGDQKVEEMQKQLDEMQRQMKAQKKVMSQFERLSVLNNK